MGKPGFAQEGTAESIGKVRLAIELWPPGSTVYDPAAEEQADLEHWLPGRSKPSEEVRKSCAFCDGVGRKQCGGCFGHGVLVCTACDGMPVLPCAQCKGSGTLEARVEALGPRQR